MPAAPVLPIIDQQLCTGCGRCLPACAHHALAIRHGVAVVAQPARCAYEGLCALICPQQAIELRFVIQRGKQ